MSMCSHSGVILVALSLLGGGLVVGCNRERKETRQLLTETVKSYAQLQPRLAELKTALGGLREEVEEIATKVPGGAELRAKYFNADEVVGVLDAKMKWLSGRIESAKRDLTRAEVVTLRDAIARTGDDMGQVSNVVVELTHERARLQRVAALLKAPYEHQLPTGYEVKAATDGVESHLIDFIEEPSKKIDKTNWFDFDRLRFAGQGADLDFQESRSQLENIARILMAYPAVRLKIGGYTDNKGSAATNRKLSDERAQAVRRALVQSGVNPERLEAEGYGAQHPVCPANDSEACRARNRRIAALVTAK
jgi:outer membrane protein OmpA-like peptidoglycan-associated protein